MRHAATPWTLRLTLVLALQFVAVAARGQWSTDVTVNSEVCTAVRDQVGPRAVSDGAGGAIVTWHDQRAGVGATFNDVYAQRIDAHGVARWTADGIGVCLAENSQSGPVIAGDGAGGAIIAWVDVRTTATVDLYAQRIGPDGSCLWTTDGVAIGATGVTHRNPAIIADGFGGAIIAWSVSQNANTIEDLYAQRINAQGDVQWTADGVPVSLAARYQVYPRLVGDGAGGAIIAWHDGRTDVTTGSDIYAQRLDGAGSPQWTSDGIACCTAAGNQYDVAVAGDGAGGAIICWTDQRLANTDIYAQRVDAGGTMRWLANGRGIATYGSNQVTPRIVEDGAGGAIIAWSTSGSSVAGQRVDAGGALLWGGGVGFSTASLASNPQLIATSTGGAIVTYNDRRAYADDIYAQKVEAGGAVSWGPTGLAVCQAIGDQTLAQVVGDGHDGAVIAWYDGRNVATAGTDIYAQQVGAGGELGMVTFTSDAPGPPATVVLRQNFPNPFNPTTVIRFDLPAGGRVRLSIFDVAGRLVRCLVDGGLPAGVHESAWDGRDASGLDAGSGHYLGRLEFAGRVEVMGMALVR